MIRRICYVAVLVSAAVHGASVPIVQSFVLVDGRSGQTRLENQDRARERFSPCSTFKIPNSLIALETAVVPDAAFTLQYDPKRDGPQTGAWSRDHDLRSAIRNSVVWYYRELARRIGPERMKSYVDRFDYGNRDISGGIDQFWLGSSLRISPIEQIAFLQRLHERRLGIADRTAGILRDILLLEATDQYRWYGKTGTCTEADHGPVAWHVGFVERDGKTSYYALNLGGGTVGELWDRRAVLVREKLAAAALIDREPPSPRSQMEAKVRAALAAFPGTVSFYAKNLDTGAAFGVRENQRVRTASTIKLPIMAAVFSAVSEGEAKWDEMITLHEADKVSGSGVLHEFSDGVQLPLRDLVHLMIVVSDNTATNLVLDRLTADYVNAEVNKLGLTQTRALRRILSRGEPAGFSREGLLPEFRPYGLGVSTPRDMVTLLERIERREVVSADASREMLAILHRQQDKVGIGRQVEGEVASKSGALDRLRSDSGIVYSEGGRIALSFTVDDMLRTDYSPENAGNKLISELTRIIVDGLSVRIDELPAPEKIVDLEGDVGHVQGIAVEGDRVWISWVNQANKTGHLGEFQLSTGKLVRSVAVQNGDRFHPGGISLEGDSIWLPVAEYKPLSSAVVQRRNKNTLALESEFPVRDHIGCVTVGRGKVYGGNWDARQFYIWDPNGHMLAKVDNPSGTRIQDFKFVRDVIVAGGLYGSEGRIDWLDPSDFHLIRRIRAGKSDRGAILTREGMTLSGATLYLLPEDATTRLFIFHL